jgi:hypothetical protein
MSMNNRIGIALSAVLLVASSSLHAEGEWTYEVAPYLWGAAMDGSASVDDIPVHVDMSFGDILDNLELGFMGAFRASKDQFSIGGDVVYMALGQHGRGPRGFEGADLDIDQIGVTLDGTYAVSESFAVLGGLRYNEVQAEVDVSGPLGHQHREGDEQWLDPFIGAVYRLPFNDEWSATLRGEVGGFGIGSDLVWVGQLTVRWQMNPHLGMLVGYRYFDMDYEINDFTYDIATSGPALGMVMTF